MEKYSSWASVPDHLKTKTQLAKLGKKPAHGQKPAARKTGGRGPFRLYDLNEAVDKRQPSSAQLAALVKARAAAEAAARCADCGLRFDHRGRYSIIYKRPDGRNICIDCDSKRDAIVWAKGVLADERAVILDTETTGLLDDDPEIVEISIIDMQGQTLLDTLVRPSQPIPAEATAIHGISDADVAGAKTYPELYPEIRRIIEGASRVVIYNSAFDYAVLDGLNKRHGLTPYFAQQNWPCAMEAYAQYVACWSDYHGNYRWWALEGGHRALGDCLATLERIRGMANG